MPNTPMTKQTGLNLALLVVLCLVIQLFVIGYSAYTGYEGRKALVTSQRAGCERGKLDRIDNAAFQRAHKKYIDRVVLAQSVKEDVKDAAREAVKTYNRTAASLTKRSQINCASAFPKASLIP